MLRLGALAVRTVAASLFAPLRFVPWRLAMMLSPRARHHGIDVFDLSIGADRTAQHFAQVKAALDLIATYQPLRLARITRDVQRIVVMQQPGPEFWPRLRACVVTPRGLSLNEEEVALTIVHEATHARLHAAGIRYRPELRERVERLCVSQEVAFAQRLPEGSALLDGIRAQLERPWWSAQDLFERRLGQLEFAGAPRWLLRTLRALFAPH